MSYKHIYTHKCLHIYVQSISIRSRYFKYYDLAAQQPAQI